MAMSAVVGMLEWQHAKVARASEGKGATAAATATATLTATATAATITTATAATITTLALPPPEPSPKHVAPPRPAAGPSSKPHTAPEDMGVNPYRSN
jgi:carbohydrate-binding DOMON domain-containing protein